MKKLILKILVTMSLLLPVSWAGPGLIGAASIIPGLGQTINGDYLQGAGYFFSTMVLMITQKDPKVQTVGQNIWFYSMYDAYRGAGGAPVDKSPIWNHYLQNFNPENIIDPFAAGFIGTAAVARNGARNQLRRDYNYFEQQRWLFTDFHKSILTYSAVGMGEEALFRGFLFPVFSEGLGVYGGAIASSLMFGFAHQGTRIENFGRSFMGAMFCWQYYRNKYKLNKNIFTHSWYDQVLVGPFDIAAKTNSNPFKNSPFGLKVSFDF